MWCAVGLWGREGPTGHASPLAGEIQKEWDGGDDEGGRDNSEDKRGGRGIETQVLG